VWVWRRRATTRGAYPAPAASAASAKRIIARRFTLAAFLFRIPQSASRK
jgi:hypothetical protein